MRVYLISVLLVLFSATLLRGQANFYQHQTKDDFHILVNSDSNAYVFGKKRKNRERHTTRSVVTSSGARYQLIFLKTKKNGKVMQVHDSTNAVIGTLLLGQGHNIMLPNDEQLLWRHGENHNWGYAKNKTYVIKGHLEGQYNTSFEYQDIEGTDTNAEAVRIIFMYRTLYAVPAKNYKAIGTIGMIARMLNAVRMF